MLSGDRPIAENARMPMAVPPSRAQMVLPTASRAASTGFIPASMRTSIPSATTMALSTSMPRAITRAPREIRCSSIP